MAIRRVHVEIATAAGTALAGIIAMIGAMELGYGWEESGPQSGYFPFYVGLILVGASFWNVANAALRHRAELTANISDGAFSLVFLSKESAIRLARFVGAMSVFLIVTLILGIYVGSLVYITWSAWRGGNHPLWALGLGAGFVVAMYLIFEVAFQMPLLKGPIEPLFGIY